MNKEDILANRDKAQYDFFMVEVIDWCIKRDIDLTSVDVANICTRACAIYNEVPFLPSVIINMVSFMQNDATIIKILKNF